MKQQTAVEWLFDQLCSNKFSWVNYCDKIYFDKTTSDILSQAKAMEKEQIEDAFYHGVDVDSWNVENPYEEAEQYYQKIYGK